LGGYAVLTGAFAALAGGFALWMRSTGRRLPESIAPGDLALITVATHKASRLIAKDRVTSAVRAPFTEPEGRDGPGELSERPRGEGLQRAVGELITCPYCLGAWVGGAFTAGLLVAPRPTRWVASAFTVLFGSDVLQVAYRKLEDTL
jgi:hypothetical protein